MPAMIKLPHNTELKQYLIFTGKAIFPTACVYFYFTDKFLKVCQAQRGRVGFTPLVASLKDNVGTKYACVCLCVRVHVHKRGRDRLT